MYFVAGWTEFKLDTKRRRSGLTGMIYVGNNTKKRNTGTFPSKTGADAGIQEITEEDVVDEI